VKPFELLCEAIANHYGIKVSTPEPWKLKTALYKERDNQREQGVFDFDDICIFQTDESTLFIANFTALEEWHARISEM